MTKTKNTTTNGGISDPTVLANIAALGGKAYTEGAAEDSLQFRATGEPPYYGSPLALDGFAMRIYSDAAELPAWWSPARDRFLRYTLHSNSLVAGIVYGETTRVKNMPFVLTTEDDDQDTLSVWQDKLQLADFGGGFPNFASKLALDYLTQDNGCFFEILGAGDAQYSTIEQQREVMRGGRIERESYQVQVLLKGERTGAAQGIAYLDAAQCWRTTNPEYPVIYTNPFTGRMTVLHWTRVHASSQFTQGYELGRGLGLCALSRAYEAMRHVKAINTYFYEKITGRAPEIFYTNVPVTHLDNALAKGASDMDAKGLRVFKDATIIAPKSGGVGAAELKIDKFGLREVGDGFSYKEQIDIMVNTLAQAFGVDVREIWAATQSGATKADAEVQDIKTTGKGRADFMSMLENALNWRVLPPEVTFQFDEVDDLADKRKAEIRAIRVQTRATQIQSGELSVPEARELAAEYDDIPADFLERVMVADEFTNVDAQSAADAPALPDDNADETEGEQLAEGEKAYSQTRSLFFNNLVTFAELAALGAVNSRNFMSSLKGELQLAGRAAFLDGIRDGAGSQSISTSELSPDELAARDALIAAQISYAANLRDFAYGDPQPSFVDILNRVSLWASKGLDGIYNTGKVMGAGNKMQAWMLGRTEKHCATCLAASKQIHRAKTWLKHDILPKADSLECGGFRCDCELRDTAEPAKGKIDRIPKAGGKHDQHTH